MRKLPRERRIRVNLNRTRSKDICGSGDMVTVGLIDWLLTHYRGTRELVGQDLADGIVAGQRLAAENCAYAGARGLFKEHGADYVRRILT